MTRYEADEVEALVKRRDELAVELEEALEWEKEYASQASFLSDELEEANAELEGLGVD